MDKEKKRLEAPKQKLVNSLQSGLAGKELSWKRQVAGNVAEEVTWARPERALNGRHLGMFSAGNSEKSQLSDKQSERIKSCN